MPPCQSHIHAQVPITNTGVFITYCHQCMAFTVSMSRHTQYDDTGLVEDLYMETPLGPFDGVDEVLRIATLYLGQLLNGSGLPWDRSDWNPTPP